jgi:hypothetical protein|tara:strand:- start:1207 stop:1437 length:231 start_codon:yes stop_codon:yes gene_type:complete
MIGAVIVLKLPEHSGILVRELGGWGKYHLWLEGRGIAQYSPVHDSLIRLPQKKVGRNTPCSCGSGKKFKKCCGRRM